MTNPAEIEKEVERAVAAGTPIEVVTASIDPELQERLKLILHNLLVHYDYSQLEGALFTCTLELAVNAARANVKTIYFEEMNWDMHESQKYTERVRAFKQKVLSHDWLKAYGEKVASRGLFVRIMFAHNADGLLIEVLNNRPLIHEDEKRIREKFSQVSKYENLVDFHRDHGSEENEGEGLGVALSVLLLKSENIPPSVFRIGSDGTQTMARIEIPFTDRQP